MHVSRMTLDGDIMWSGPKVCDEGADGKTKLSSDFYMVNAQNVERTDIIAKSAEYRLLREKHDLYVMSDSSPCREERSRPCVVKNLTDHGPFTPLNPSPKHETHLNFHHQNIIL